MCGCLDLFTAMIIVMALNIACCVISLVFLDIFNAIVYGCFTIPFVLAVMDREHTGKRKAVFITYAI